MNDGLTPNEQRMLDAILSSGIKVEPGKRYTLAEVCAIIESDFHAKVDDDAQLSQRAVGALMGTGRAAAANGMVTAHRKIRAALVGTGVSA